MLRITVDTNIYISGLNYGGNPYRVLELARAGNVLVAVSDQILDEVERVLQGKFRWPQHRAQQARRDIRDFAQYVNPTGRLEIIKEDPDDNRILECAIAGRSEYIVSGDKDLLRLGKLASIKIINVSDFLTLLGEPEPRAGRER